MNRLYLLRRRTHIALRFRREFGWSWWVSWQMSRVHQRHMLRILEELAREERIVQQFRAELDCDLDRLTWEGAI